MVIKSEQEGIEINLEEVSLIMFEKVWSVSTLPNMSRNIVNIYVLKLLSLRKSESLLVSIGPQICKI